MRYSVHIQPAIRGYNILSSSGVYGDGMRIAIGLSWGKALAKAIYQANLPWRDEGNHPCCVIIRNSEREQVWKAQCPRVNRGRERRPG